MIRRLLTALFACVLVAFGLLVWQLSQGPLSLAFLTPYLEEAVRSDQGEWRLDIGEVVLMHDLRVHARNVDLLGADGTPLLRVPDVVIRPSLRALVHGIAAVSAIEISDAEAGILRRPDGSFGISVSGSAEPAGTGAGAGAGAAAEFLEDLLEPVREDRAVGYLRRFRVTNARLSIKDVETGAAWIVENAEIGLSRGAKAHRLTFGAALVAEKADESAAQLEARLVVRAAGSGFLVDGEARATGVDTARLGLYWPQNAAVTARRWVTKNIREGRVAEIGLRIALASTSGIDFRLGKLEGDMRYEGLEVRWNDDAPLVTAVTGTSTFDRSSLRFNVTSATASGVRVRSARINLFDLDTDKEHIAIEVKTEGPLARLIRLVPDAPSKLPFESAGDARIDLQAAFPLRAKLRFADVDLKVDADPQSMQLRHAFGAATVSGRLRYRKRPKRTAMLTADLDLGAARIDTPGLQWSQPAGKAGKIEFHVELGEGPLTFEPLQVDCPELHARGSITVGADGGSGAAHLRNVVHGATELDRADIDWSPGMLKARFGKGRLDLAPLIGKGQRQAGGTDDGPSLDLDLEAALLERVSFDADSWLENVSGTIVRRDDVWQQVDLRAELPKPLWSASGESTRKRTFGLQISPAGPGWRVDGRADDFGALLRAVNLSDDVRGGMLEVSGRADSATSGAVLRSHVKVTDFLILDAPLVVRILTVAALDRVIGTLKGDGLHFDALKGTLIVRGDRYELENVRAHGSSLGWTAKGWVDTGAGGLDVDGSIIPAYQASKVLRKIPLLGNLLLGSEGRALFAINYRVRGSLRDPKVSTNPLSALTPGFLREVWELGY